MCMMNGQIRLSNQKEIINIQFQYSMFRIGLRRFYNIMKIDY